MFNPNDGNLFNKVYDIQPIHFKKAIIKIQDYFIDRYKILQCIGKGRHSKVFRAYDLINNRDVAIKIEFGSSQLLKHEHKIMKLFEFSPYVCDQYEFGPLPSLAGKG